jgi:hypothetical protein
LRSLSLFRNAAYIHRYRLARLDHFSGARQLKEYRVSSDLIAGSRRPHAEIQVGISQNSLSLESI